MSDCPAPCAKTEVFVPGRVCLLGEHSDWAASFINREKYPLITPGRCLAYGTTVGLYTRAELTRMPYDGEAAVAPHTFLMTSTEPNGTEHKTECALTLEAVESRAKAADFYSYVFGTITVLLQRYSDKILAGTEKQRLVVSAHNYKTDLPVQKGLSSSAACCVTIARIFNDLFKLGLDTPQEMDIAYAGEIFTGSECGRLDQCVAYGKKCVDLHFEGHKLDTYAVELPRGAHFYFVVADLLAGKNTKKILHELSSCFPDHKNDPVKMGVQNFLGQMSLDFVDQARVAMEKGDAAALGAVFTAYQESFDKNLAPACDELISPKLHRVLNDPRVRELTSGGKGVGSQGDGTVQFVCHSAESQKKLAELLETSDLHCHPFCFELSGPK